MTTAGLLFVVGCSKGGEDPDGGDGGGGDAEPRDMTSTDMTGDGSEPLPDLGECTVLDNSTSFPPYPFNFANFRSTILPLFQKGKTTAGVSCIPCHVQANATNGNFAIPMPGTSDECVIRDFFYKLVGNTAPPGCNMDTPDALLVTGNVASSRILARFVENAAGAHTGGPWFADANDPNYLTLANFATEANTALCAGGVTCYDPVAFQKQVAPVLNQRGCGNPGCHAPGSPRNFIWDSMGMDQTTLMANLSSFQNQANLANPEQSAILLYPSGNMAHTGGALLMPGSPEANTVLNYIQQSAAKPGCGPGDGSTPGCPNGNPAPDINAINLQVFELFLWPYVFGPVSGQPSASDCSNNQCHGNAARQRNSAALRIRDPDLYCGSEVGQGDPVCSAPDRNRQIMQENIRELMCQINPQNPLRSPLLACPLGGQPPDCPVDHDAVGGGKRWPNNTADARYQAVANFVYAARGQFGVHDDLFYRRRVSELITALEYDSVVNQGQTVQCADQSCHVSNNALAAFTSPEQFTNASLLFDFFQPAQSALVIFPTNLSALNPLLGGNENNQGNFATVDGFNFLRYGPAPHDAGGGGTVIDLANNFASDISGNQQLAFNILNHFLPGLQPDPVGGDVVDWLIAERPFFLAQITDPGPFGQAEGTLKPVHFEDPNAAADPNNVNGGRWLDFFSLNADGTAKTDVDIIQYYQQPVVGGQINSADGDTTFLFAYAYNLSQQNNLFTTIQVTSDQPYVLYFNGSPIITAIQGGTLQGTAPLRRGQNEMMLKIQRQNNEWQFNLKMLDQGGQNSINNNGIRNVVLRMRQVPGQL